MITLYTWTTPNGRKISVMLEELGIPYEVKPVNLGKGEQLQPDYLVISPNNKIPAIVDHDTAEGPVNIFESGAILIYLAEKYGRFLPAKGAARAQALEWLMWQMGGVGPMFGQANYFGVTEKGKNEAALQRYVKESERLLGVMDRQLEKNAYLAGSEYSIADIATYPWALSATTYAKDILGDLVAARPHVQRWLKEVGARPAVQRGMNIPSL
ncbi:MAG: glutathione binding-like protein [Pedobacter sp.]|nr:glutathione binding-like protein [Pedobacter sp.]